jgi:hypothetical protein
MLEIRKIARAPRSTMSANDLRHLWMPLSGEQRIDVVRYEPAFSWGPPSECGNAILTAYGNAKLVPEARKCQQGALLDGNHADHGANSSAPMFRAWADLDVPYKYSVTA